MFSKLAVLSLALFTQLASAETPIRMEMAHLNRGKIDSKVLGNNNSFDFGTLQIDYVFNKLTLTIVREKNCPSGMACTKEAVYPIHVVLPIVSIKKGSCGEMIVVASEDLRPADGMLQQVVVKDYRTMLCEIYVPYSTTVEYRTESFLMGAPMNKTRSYLAGERLSPVSPRY